MNEFSRIYQRNAWNGVETRSGPGSGTAATRHVAVAIQRLCEELRISSVVDVACGEGFWQPELPGYLGLDIASEAIAQAQRLHPDRQFRVADVREGCPRADLVLCRDAMQHLSPSDGLRVLDQIKSSGSAWLLASTYVGGQNSGPIGKYVYYEPDLEEPPFSLPPSVRLLRDGFDYEQGDRIRDARKMLGLWSLQ